MVSFIRTHKDPLLGDRHYWKIGKLCRAIVFEDAICSITLRNKDNNSITKECADCLGIGYDSIDIKLNRTIDSYLIECPKEKLEWLLAKIEDICYFFCD